MQIQSLGKWKRRSLPVILAGALAGLLSISAALPAQSGKGTLAGVVLAADGAPVKAAQVLYQVADGSAPHVLRTDAQGRFHSALLRAGLYEVRAEAGGKSSEWAHNVTVPSGGEQNLTLRLVRDSAPSR